MFVSKSGFLKPRYSSGMRNLVVGNFLNSGGEKIAIEIFVLAIRFEKERLPRRFF
jgi:hypothetical protein